MIAGAAESRRLVLRALPKSGIHHANTCSLVRKRSGLRFPPWPSLRSLSQLHRGGDDGDKNPPESSRQVDTNSSLNSFEGLENGNETAEDDIWSSAIALEASRRKLDWRHQLTSKEQLEFESDLDSVENPRRRLVDIHGADLELWQELLLYRLRIHGVEASLSLCERLVAVGDRHRLRLWELPRMWRGLETLATESVAALVQIVKHIKLVGEIYGDQPEGFYQNIMLRKLAKDRAAAYLWHLLMRDFITHDGQAMDFLNTVWSNQVAFQSCEEVFRNIFKVLPPSPGLYAWILFRLIEMKRYDEIEHWHALLVETDQTPEEFATFGQLVEALESADRKELLMDIAEDLEEKGCVDAEQWLAGLQQEESHWRAEFLKFSANRKGTTMSDDFVARLFATEFFSIGTVLGGLNALNVECIGPVALRAAIFRVAGSARIDAGHVQETIRLLQEANIEPQEAAFSKLVLKYADQGHNDKLEYLLALGPVDLEDMTAGKGNPIDDTSHQNSFGSETTLDVLTVEEAFRMLTLELSNQRLRELLLLSNPYAVGEEVLDMLNKGEQIGEKLFRWAWHRTRILKAPVGVWLQCQIFLLGMQAGHKIPAEEWKQLIETLSEKSMITTLQSTCLQLVCWLAGPGAPDIGSEGASLPEHEALRETNQPVRMLPDAKSKLLRDIFDRDMIRTLVLYGFIKSYRISTSKLSGRAWQRATLHSKQRQNRLYVLMQDKAMSGIKFLKKLEKHGLSQSPDQLASACEATLLLMFGPFHGPFPHGEKSRHHRLKFHRRAELEDYAAAIETIWGSEIFFPKGREIRHTRLSTYARELIASHCEAVAVSRMARADSPLHHATRSFALSRRESPSEAHKFQPPKPLEQRLSRAVWMIEQLPRADTDMIAAEFLPEYNIAYADRLTP